MQTLKNDILTVQVSEMGAELHSIVRNGYEYLWQGDPAFWGRRSPVLFPIVGSVWEKKYRVDGREYELGQHGFARDMKFELVSESDSEVWYRLESTPETLAKYPWPFVLEIGYKLEGSSIEVLWKVSNPGSEEMFFQIGAHPAFNYPGYDAQTSDRGYFSFDKPEGLECVAIKEKGCVDVESTYSLNVEDGLLPLKSDSFDNTDAFVLQNSQVSRVTLHGLDKAPFLTLCFDAPVVGLWSPPGKNAPFVCIEPWYGRCDRVAFIGDYREKDWVNSLAPGTVFSASYTIVVE